MRRLLMNGGDMYSGFEEDRPHGNKGKKTHNSGSRPNKERDEKILEMFTNGSSYKTIATIYSLTVSQVGRVVHRTARDQGLTVIKRTNTRGPTSVEVIHYGKNSRGATVRFN